METRPSKQCEFCIYLHDKSLNQCRPGGQKGPGDSGGPGGPGRQCGPGGQGCLGGQRGPGDQVCQCIWFTWSKQSDYRENLRCHACD